MLTNIVGRDTVRIDGVAHACNLSTEEVEIQGFWGVQGPPGLQSETVSKREKRQGREEEEQQ